MTRHNSPAQALDGGCQCRELRYSADAPPLTFYACHCRDCQNQSGSAFGLSLWVSSDTFSLTRGKLAVFQLTADSGRSKYCGFCSQCGTRISHSDFHPNDPCGTGYLSLKAGTLDQSPEHGPVAHIWLRSAQPWVRDMLGLQENPAHCFDTEPDDESILLELWQKTHPAA